MVFVPMADPWTEWAGDIAKWGMVVGVLVMLIIVGGIVLIVKAIAARKGPSTQCTNCGKTVKAGNAECRACGAKVNWAKSV